MDMKRVLCVLLAIVMAIVGIGAVGVSLVLLAWPTTNAISGKADDWQIITPYVIAATFCFASSAFVARQGFKSAKP